MPVIQQERGQRSIKGLPIRWGRKAYRELRSAAGEPGRYSTLSALLDEVTNAPLPLDATDAQIVLKATQCADECQRQAHHTSDQDSIRRRVQMVCRLRGIAPPQAEKFKPFFDRACDPAWWRRQLRSIHGRTFEHAAIRLGFVSKFAGAYASDETVKRRTEQGKRNRRILESTKVQNELEQAFTLAELADKGTANKSIRRGELMLRMRGLEEIAIESGHAGLFVTLTCPSKYHAIQWASGSTNPAYNGATPREAQAYLQTVWSRVRAKLHRNGCRPYGFRIAEPHHDGCPHWHVLLFVAPGQLELLEAAIREHALAEDGDEPGAASQRVKFVRIDAAKGTAAGYIAKYVSKNIDGEHIEEHKQTDGTIVGPDMVGDAIIKPAQRVDAWAGVWGIRQFQPIGCPPVTVWRELRRVEAARIEKAPASIRRAWAAAQKIEGSKEADFADYIRAQGGVNVGRNYAIGVAVRQAEIQGRYGLEEGTQPVGIYAKAQPNAIYESTRYRWSRAGRSAPTAFSWTRVNNCTAPSWTEYAAAGEAPAEIEDSDWFESGDFRAIALETEEIDQITAAAWTAAHETRARTVWTKPKPKIPTPKGETPNEFFGAF